jgi:predicted ATPase
MYSLDVAIDKKVKVPISEVGFGLSQSLPVLLKGLLAPVGSLLILEQPEIHLHPLWKANLADLLLVWAQDGKQLLVETHSTELIDKLRLLVIQKPKIKNLINIIFVEQPDLDKTGTILRTIELNDLGVPSEWPKGFCDQTTNLMEEIVLARAAARRKGEMVK